MENRRRHAQIKKIEVGCAACSMCHDQNLTPNSDSANENFVRYLYEADPLAQNKVSFKNSNIFIRVWKLS